jgi:hypothetical protein
MTRHGSFGIAMLLLLVCCGFAAAGAQAEQPAATCVPEAGAYSDAHCKTETGSGKFKLVEIPAGTEIKTTTTNAKTASETTAAAPARMRGTIAGLETEIECTGVSGSGTLTSGTTSASGTGTFTNTGCVVLKPAGRGCKVKGGSLTTNLLKSTTAGQTGTNAKVQPASGSELGSIAIENCLNNKPPNTTYPISGSFVSSGSGATATTTEAAITSQGTLTFGGNAAGIEGALTTSKEGGNPIT